MPRQLRIYHPEHPVTWRDRLFDLFTGRVAPRPEPGVDYTLLRRNAARAARALLDEVLSITLLGDEMVRVDTRWGLPENPSVEMAAAIVARLRFVQVQVGGFRVHLPIRWVEFSEAPHGCTLLVRLLEAPNTALRNVLEANLSEGDGATWAEVAIGRE
jgi:hypothetical protein